MCGEMLGLFLAVFLLPACTHSTSIHWKRDHDDDLSLFPTVHPWAAAYLPEQTVQEDERQCVEDSRALREAVVNGTLWASRMLDASARGPTGALWGARYHLGSFDGCLSAGRVSPLGARYCLVNVSLEVRGQRGGAPGSWSHIEDLDPHLDVRYALQGTGQVYGYYRMGEVFLALCVPHSCSAASLERGLRAKHTRDLGQRLHLAVSPLDCSSAEDLTRKGALYDVIWWALVALTVLAFASPLLGWPWWDWRRHCDALARPDPCVDGIDFSPLSGIRFFNTLLIVIAHRGGIDVGTATVSNQPGREANRTSLEYVTIYHGQLLVDSFLCLSGMLFVLTSNKDSPMRAILRRLSRLWPLYALIVLLTGHFFPFISFGPLWKSWAQREGSACVSRGWTNLLFINNYVTGDLGTTGCLLYTWGLAVDMQLFLLSLLLLPFLRSGARLVLPLLLVATAVPFLEALWHELPAIMAWTPKMINDVYGDSMFVDFYITTHMHAAPYVVGLALGMVVYKLMESRVRLSSAVTWACTLGTLLGMLVVMVSSVVVMDPERSFSVLASALYSSLTPVLWAALLGVLVVALLFGQDTAVRSFLSWQPFVSLSRLTYGVYLLSMIVQIIAIGVQRDLRTITLGIVLFVSLSDLVVVFSLSFWLYLIVEAPCRAMIKDLLKRRPSSKSSDKEWATLATSFVDQVAQKKIS